MVKSWVWAPTVALSWLWGLGFFYSFQTTLANGLAGFAAFAIPNALGLFAFGWLLGDPRRDIGAIFSRVQARYTGLFLACQVFAVAITLFAGMRYLLMPLLGPRAVAIASMLLLAATWTGHVATVRRLKTLHAAYLALGLAAALVVLAGLLRVSPRPPVNLLVFDKRFYGLLVPTLVGFLLGPWTDVQHWQRAVAIRAEGCSVRRAYAGGALLFFGLITLNAGLAVAAGPVVRAISSDGLVAYQGSVAGAVSRDGDLVSIVALLVWAGVMVVSTLDSFFVATRWLLRPADGDTSIAVALGLTTPLWFLATATLIAILMIVANIGMIYLMMPFATLIAGGAACLVCESLGGRPRYSGLVCASLGLAAYVACAAGYLGDNPALMNFAPLVALVGALPAACQLVARRPAPRRATAISTRTEVARAAFPAD